MMGAIFPPDVPIHQGLKLLGVCMTAWLRGTRSSTGGYRRGAVITKSVGSRCPWECCHPNLVGKLLGVRSVVDPKKLLTAQVWLSVPHDKSQEYGPFLGIILIHVTNVTPQSHCQMISPTLLVLQGEEFTLVVVMGSLELS